MRKLSRVGIIGGAGPMAGLLLCQKIIHICQKKYGCQEDADFPYIMLISYPFDDMLYNRSNYQQKVIQEQLRTCLEQCLQNEIDIAAISCNTLHEFLDFQHKISLIHMIEETAVAVQKTLTHPPLVLGSTTSYQYQLHRKYFNCFYPDAQRQEEIQNIIDIILTGAHSNEECQKLAQVLYARETVLLYPECQKIGLILGCTEFSVLNEQFPLWLHGFDKDFIVFDPMDIVAEKICNIIFKREK